MHLYLGAGSAVPTQLVLVPMLFLLPPAVVPACVRLALVAADAVDRPQRILASLADAWHAVGPSLVFAVAGAPDPSSPPPACWRSRSPPSARPTC